MSALCIEKVNDHKIKPIKLEVQGSGLPIKGKDIINELSD